jgi:Ca2+-binding RTX toxin-like protein
MAYNVTGTAGNDTLNQSTDTGPGTVVGLAGDDCILQGTGSATITGDSGNDIVVTQAGNTGTVDGGTENDSIFASGNSGSMVLLLNAGADTVNFSASTAAQTIVGGTDSSDGNDCIFGSNGADLMFGNGGNDILDVSTTAVVLDNNTAIGGFGDDSIVRNTTGGTDLAFGNEGNDTIYLSGGSDTDFGGQGNDCLYYVTGSGNPLFFGNEGNDTVIATTATAATVVGGQNSADGNDTILTGAGADFVFGNGGNDTINVANGANTVVGGFGNDTITAGTAADLVFANESNDTVAAGDGNNTVFGGQGNDSILGGAGRDTFQGNEGNDTIQGDALGGSSIDTIAGGTGNDVFAYADALGDGSNAAGGGPVEQITDVDFSVDRFDTATLVTFATNTGAGTGGTLADSATNAIAAAAALNGGVVTVAAQFTFAGRTYLAINQDGVATFADPTDLLLDITGATGAISGSNFI